MITQSFSDQPDICDAIATNVKSKGNINIRNNLQLDKINALHCNRRKKNEEIMPPFLADTKEQLNMLIAGINKRQQG